MSSYLDSFYQLSSQQQRWHKEMNRRNDLWICENCGHFSWAQADTALKLIRFWDTYDESANDTSNDTSTVSSDSMETDGVEQKYEDNLDAENQEEEKNDVHINISEAISFFYSDFFQYSGTKFLRTMPQSH